MSNQIVGNGTLNTAIQMETTQKNLMTYISTIIGEVIAFVKDVITWSLSGGLVYQIYLCILAALMVLAMP